MINKPLKILTVSIMLCSAGQSFASAIHNAVYTNDIGKVQRIIRENPTQLYALDENGQSPIHLAISNDSIPSLASLMGNGAVNLNIQNGDGDTPLVYAIKLNKYNSILFLLQKGSNPYYIDSSGKDALYYVKKFGDDNTKMIFDEVIKYQQENARKQKSLLARRDTSVMPSSSSSGKLKSVNELIAENAVQRELLGQTSSQLDQPSPIINRPQNNRDEDDLSNVKVNPVKEKRFIYKDDLDADSNESQDETKIDSLSKQVSQLTSLLRQVLKPEQEAVSAPVKTSVATSNTVNESLTNNTPSVKNDAVASINQAKQPDPDTEAKIKAFIALNEQIGNGIPVQPQVKSEPVKTEKPKNKDSSVGIYQTQERGLTVNAERSIIPDNWLVQENKAPEVKDDKQLENNQEDIIPEKEKAESPELTKEGIPAENIPQNELKQKENAIVEETKKGDSNTSKEVAKDIPSLLLKKTIEAKETTNSKVEDESKPIITENQIKNIEDKINTENSRSTMMNAFLASCMTIGILAVLSLVSFFGYSIYNKKKKQENKTKISHQSAQNRERIRQRITKTEPWNNKDDKKPD